MSVNLSRLEREEKEADKLWEETYGEPTIDKTEVETFKVVEEVKDTSEPSQDAETFEKPAAVVETEPEPDKVVEKPVVDAFEQKYKTLQGKYNAELPRLNSEVAQWKEYANKLQTRIEALETASKAPVTPDIDPDIDNIAELYPEVAVLIKKLQAKQQEEIKSIKDEFETKIAPELKSVKEDIHLSKQDRFDISMSRLGVPDWKEIDRDPAFIEWLNEKVPYTNATKLDLIQQSAKAHDAETTAQFFLDFKKTLKTDSISSPALSSPKEDSQEKLRKFIAPAQSSGGGTPLKTGQSGLTWAAYQKFMSETTGPKYKFRPENYGGKTEAQVEAMFDAAITSGKMA